MDTSKYSTVGNRKLIAMIVVIFSILLIVYTAADSAVADTAIWGIVSIGGAFMTGNLIEREIKRKQLKNNLNEEAEY